MKCKICKERKVKAKGKCDICYSREYRKNNKERISKVAKIKQQRTRKQTNAYVSKYYQGAGREKYLVRKKSQYRLKKGMIRKKEVCENCGTKENLEMHHKEYKEGNESIMILCKKCHREVHNDSS